ncbi:barstar family protein [Winslowiella iniecta]|uniref:barstar family protein n=1 Tax=Winslowiella iniecta TaxID=1560201 RepID=UPI00092D5B6A|nr:barstar family protein [Winslowiella iniecta]
MKMIKLSIDFSKVKTINDFHHEMNLLFGFPDFYGRNFHAFIDCLTSLRFPEDGMTNVHIEQDECILLEVMNINSVSSDIRHDFFLSIQAINGRCISYGENASILLLLCEPPRY